MRLLIDSHAFIWFCEGNPALSSVAREAMEDGGNERFISHATPWEMAIKLALGKLQLQSDFAVIFPGVLNANGFAMLTPNLEHYRAPSICHGITATRLTGSSSHRRKWTESPSSRAIPTSRNTALRLFGSHGSFTGSSR